MRSTLAIGVVLLVAGWLGGSAMSEPATGQTMPREMFDGMLPWAQHPGDIVTIDSQDARVMIAAGSSVEIYQVPHNRWLLVSVCKITQADIALVENYQGTRLTKVGSRLASTGLYTPAGLNSFVAFRPGSKVEVYNWETSPRDTVDWHIGGFLVRP